MSRMVCRCGETLSNTSVPNDIELTVYTDKEWDEICNCESIEPWKIPLPTYDVWKCPKCGRIYVYKGDCETPIRVYKIEE